MSGHTPWREIFPYRVAPAVNSWNLSGWTVEHWATSIQRWVPTSRFYWTRRGATRSMHALYREYCWWRQRERGWWD